MATVLAPVGAGTAEVRGVSPIIIDLGREKKGRIRDLKRGRGRLVDEVASVLNSVRADLGDDGNKQLVPIILIYKKKKRRGRNRGGGRVAVSGGGGFFPFNLPFLG